MMAGSLDVMVVGAMIVGLFLVSSVQLMRWLLQGGSEARTRLRMVGGYFVVTLGLAVLGYGLEQRAFLPELMHQLTLLMAITALMAGLTLPVLARWRLERRQLRSRRGR